MGDIKPRRGMFLMTAEIAEKIFSVPVEEREALLAKLVIEQQAEFIGTTEKDAPELATDLIRAGYRAKSYVKGKGKKEAPVPLTKPPKSDKL